MFRASSSQVHTFLCAECTGVSRIESSPREPLGLLGEPLAADLSFSPPATWMAYGTIPIASPPLASADADTIPINPCVPPPYTNVRFDCARARPTAICTVMISTRGRRKKGEERTQSHVGVCFFCSYGGTTVHCDTPLRVRQVDAISHVDSEHENWE